MMLVMLSAGLAGIIIGLETSFSIYPGVMLVLVSLAGMLRVETLDWETV